MSTTPLITRVVLKNFKSIAECDVRLGPVTFLVGPNGSGKSNFIDGLRFVADALRKSLGTAIESRHGFHTVLRQGSQQPEVMLCRLEFQLGVESTGFYQFELTAQEQLAARVLREECSVRRPDGHSWFRVAGGNVESSEAVMPSVGSETLYLVNASGIEAFASCYRHLSRIAVYSPAAHHTGWARQTDDGNLPALVLRIHRQNPVQLERIVEYLAVISRGVTGIKVRVVDGVFLMHFLLQDRPPLPWLSMSDGTLNALAILVALFQPREVERPLIGIEEPESGLHPAAAEVIFDALTEAAISRQVIVTTHSADLLSRMEADADLIRAVSMENGQTLIGPVHPAGFQAIREQLYTAGELLRMNQLVPAQESLLPNQGD